MNPCQVLTHRYLILDRCQDSGHGGLFGSARQSGDVLRHGSYRSVCPRIYDSTVPLLHRSPEKPVPVYLRHQSSHGYGLWDIFKVSKKTMQRIRFFTLTAFNFCTKSLHYFLPLKERLFRFTFQCLKV